MEVKKNDGIAKDPEKQIGRRLSDGSATDIEAQPDGYHEASHGKNTGHKEEDIHEPIESPYSIFEHRQKVFSLISVSFMALISPLSSSIYYPALDQISAELGVTVSETNISIVTFQIFQAIAPSFVGSFSDNHGRRPAYIFCYVVYLCANIGLALQTSYPALLVLRCLQSAGSSGTIALGSAVAADMCTRAERGKYMMYTMLGTTLGPAIGPVFGGLIAQYLGWRWIFWVLAILSAVLLLFTIFFLPETCRAVVGNGSVPPPRWNRSVMTIVTQHRLRKLGEQDVITAKPETLKKRPNPLTSVRICFEREAGIVLLFMGLISMGYFLCLTTLSTQLHEKFGFDPVIVGLCYLPVGVGSFLSRRAIGPLLDWNFKRHAAKVGMPIDKNRQQNLDNFDVEKVRLQVNLPVMYVGCAAIITYGWVMYYSKLVGILIALFPLGMCLSGGSSILSMLIIDTHKESPATAAAASNLVRCLLSAAASGFGLPLIHAIGIGWTGVLVAFVWIAASSMLWLVYWKGLAWRQAQVAKQAEREQEDS